MIGDMRHIREETTQKENYTEMGETAYIERGHTLPGYITKKGSISMRHGSIQGLR